MASFFINETGAIGSFVVALTETTGSPFLSYFVIFMIIVFLAAMFRLGIIEIAMLLVPMTVILMAFNGEWYAIGGFLLIALAVFFARNWFVPAR